MSELVVKILIFLILSAFLVVFLNSYNSSAAMLIVLTAASVILVLALKTVFPAITALGSLLDSNVKGKEYFSAAFKALGIAYVSNFAADVCRDFGQNALASKAEFAGRCAIFIVTVPMIVAIAETALGLAKL